EPPAAAALERALALLRSLGAVDAGGLTELGRLLARVPAQPRLARLLVAGHELGVPAGAAAAAAILGERDPWLIEDRRVEQHGSDSDVLDRVRALLAFERDGRSPELQRGAAHACLAAKRQLERIARGALGTPRDLEGDASDALLVALLAAFPDRLTRRRADDPTRGVLVGGRGVRLAPECAVREGELFLSIDLDGKSAEALVRKASLVQREWVDGGRTHAVFEPVFDAARLRVVGRKRVYLGELLLEETDAPISDAERAESVLVAAARTDLERALGLADPERRGFLARVRSLADWMPELELPHVDDGFLAELLPELCAGATSFADLQRASLEHAILARLDHRQRAALDREAPERWQVPSGSRIRLTYEPGRPPVLAARIQELFGLRETPRVAANRVPVLLHLLAPNGRPEQVTDDLASFWSDTYFRVRKDLRPRYPKHAWPDDPTTAAPQRRPQRRR
ncbi:MAG: ATP-dependent helicase C-terminal domain-containing protein, partial [Planctomycetota bacterium]